MVEGYDVEKHDAHNNGHENAQRSDERRAFSQNEPCPQRDGARDKRDEAYVFINGCHSSFGCGVGGASGRNAEGARKERCCGSDAHVDASILRAYENLVVWHYRVAEACEKSRQRYRAEEGRCDCRPHVAAVHKEYVRRRGKHEGARKVSECVAQRRIRRDSRP